MFGCYFIMVEILLWLHCHASREGDQNVLFDASKGLAIMSRNPIISENPEIGNCMPIDLAMLSTV